MRVWGGVGLGYADIVHEVIATMKISVVCGKIFHPGGMLLKG